MLENFMRKKDSNGARTFLTDNNHYNSSVDWICRDNRRQAFFFPLVPAEWLSSLISKNHQALNHVLDNAERQQEYVTILKDILAANQNHKLIKKINKAIYRNKMLQATLVPPPVAPKIGLPSQNLRAFLDQQKIDLVKNCPQTAYRRSLLERTVSGLKLIGYSTSNDALLVLDFLNLLASRCHKVTLENTDWRSFHKELKTAMTIAAGNNNPSSLIFDKAFSQRCPYIIKRLNESQHLKNAIL
jgi:hypothetical protein